MLLALEVFVRFPDLCEVEDLVYDWNDLVSADQPIHVLKVGDAANEDTTEDGGLG